MEMRDPERANNLNNKLSQICVFLLAIILMLKEDKHYKLAQWNPGRRGGGQIFN